MDETTGQNNPTSEPGPGDAAPPDTHYELVPADAAPKRSQAPKPPNPREEGLLDGFDEDADFDHDPEVDQALGRTRKSGAGKVKDDREGRSSGDDSPDSEGSTIDAMVREGRGTTRQILIVGASVTGAAALASAVEAGVASKSAFSGIVFLSALGTLFNIALHTITGVGAVGISAALLGKALKRSDLAAARMLVACAVCALGFHLNMGAQAMVLGLALAGGGYFLVVWILFRLRPSEALVVGACHFAIWLLFYLHHALADLTTPAPAAGP